MPLKDNLQSQFSLQWIETMDLKWKPLIIFLLVTSEHKTSHISDGRLLDNSEIVIVENNNWDSHRYIFKFYNWDVLQSNVSHKLRVKKGSQTPQLQNTAIFSRENVIRLFVRSNGRYGNCSIILQYQWEQFANDWGFRWK